MLRRVPDFFAFRSEHGSSAGASADRCADGRAFPASRDGTDRRSDARGTADNSRITLLCRLRYRRVWFRGNADGLTFGPDNLRQGQLEARHAFDAAGFLGINDMAS